MSLAAEITFWAAFAAIFATYFGYPLCLLVLARRNRPHRIDVSTPSVTLIVSAYNEESVIREKLENSLAIDYPRDRLEVLVISDESVDATDAIAASFDNRGVVLCRQSPRRGKSLGLTRFVPKARGEILVFSDANSMYESDAIRRLVRHFADPSIGYVVGHQRYVNEGTEASVSESLYWSYEVFLKTRESRLGSVVGGDGAIYAIRRELFEPLRDDDINDFYIPLRIVARGHRGLFDHEAICYERTAPDFEGEFRRKVRIVNRSLRAVTRVSQTLNPFRVGWFAFELALHKVVRWLVPFFLAAMLIASGLLGLIGQTEYLALFCLQIGFYALGLLRFVPGVRRLKPVYLAYYFTMVNVAAGLGVLTLLAGKRFVTWNPQRQSDEQNVAAVRS